jgi:uncharacterized protein
MTTRHARSGSKLDAFQLARERGVAQGEVDAHALSRVDDMLGDGPASIAWKIEGSADALGRPALTIGMKGSVPLTCQRCLDEFDYPIDQQTSVLLARDERELAALDGDSDAEVVLAGVPVDPLALVEDELVLALPFAPRHPADVCSIEQQSS